MPIDVACECCWKKKVADEHAGKRAKCPPCATPLTIPQPVSEEDAAAAMPDDAADVSRRERPTEEDLEPARGAYSLNSEPKPTLEPRESKPGPPKIKIKTKGKKTKSSEGSSGFTISGGVAGALGLLLLGGLFVAISLANDRISIYGVILVGVGLFRLVAGLLGHEEE